MRGVALRDFLGLDDDGLHVRGLCSFGSTPSSVTSTTNSSPWSGQQPYLADIFAQAQNLDQTTTPAYYPNDTYVGMTSGQQNAASQLANYGASGGNSGLLAANANVTSTLAPGYTNGTQAGFNTGENTLGQISNGTYQSAASPNYNQAQGVLANEMSSSYLNPNNSPAFQSVVNNTLASVMPGIDASYVNGNRAGGGLAASAAAQGATNAVGNLEQQQYNTNQQIQQSAAQQASTNNQNATANAMGAAGLGTQNYLTQQGNQLKGDAMAPMIDQAQSGDLQTALAAQGVAQQNAQNQTNANVQQWNYNQMLPWNQLGLYDQYVTGNYGGSTTATNPYYQNSAANLMGGASSGLGLLNGIGNLAGGSGGGASGLMSLFSNAGSSAGTDAGLWDVAETAAAAA